MPLRILLADDCRNIRDGVRSLLERDHLAIIGEAEDGYEAVEMSESLDPDVVILDISMPRLNGLEAARQIHAAHPAAHLVVLTGHTTPYHIETALRNGVRGFVSKCDAAEDLVTAVHAVSLGGTFLSSSASRVQHSLVP
jgi:DNA-binding NarL/FixJ family response regulator